MIKKELVGVDINIGSSMPMDYASSLCKILDAELVALHIIEELQVYNLFRTVPAQKREEILEERMMIMLEANRLGEKYGIKSSGMILEGISPAEEMLREVHKANFDLIVVGCHAKSVLMECLLGGVSSQIIHHSKVPVLVVKTKRSFSRILMPATISGAFSAVMAGAGVPVGDGPGVAVSAGAAMVRPGRRVASGKAAGDGGSVGVGSKPPLQAISTRGRPRPSNVRQRTISHPSGQALGFRLAHVSAGGLWPRAACRIRACAQPGAEPAGL